MIQDQRVFNGTTDISVAVNDFRSASAAFAYTTGNYMYIGSILPFNNLWFEMGTVNSNAATASISMWWGNEWVSAVDIIDGTSGLTATGRLQWNTNINKGWDREQYSTDVTGLSSAPTVYNFYWLRLSWSANFSAGTTIKYIGQKFSDDTTFYTFYPDLNNTTILTSFDASKTNWNDQHYMAAEHIIRDLRKGGIIKSKGQILDYSLLVDASCHKVAELIYQSFGKPYADQMATARKAYKEACELKFYNVDHDADGRLSEIERGTSTTYTTR